MARVIIKVKFAVINLYVGVRETYKTKKKRRWRVLMNERRLIYVH